MKVTIERFKNIECVELPVDGILLLVGGNNSGKSSVLQAIQFGASVAQTTKMQRGSWTKKDRLSTSIGQGDLVYSPIKDVLSLAPNGKLKEEESHAIRITYRENNEETRVSVRRGKNKNILLELNGRTLGERLQSIDRPYCALSTGLAGIPSEEEYETKLMVRKSAAKGDSNSVFRNILFQLKEIGDRWERFQNQIGRIFPGYRVDVSFDEGTNETINCTVIKSDVEYPIDTCGTGVLQAIQIFSYINLFEPKVLLLDEPDSHLHPNNQKQLALELIEASQGGLNVIVSTHSKHLVEALLDHSKLVWMRSGATQAFVDDYEVKALLEIGALDVGERLGHPTYVFLTEDENQGVLERILESNGYNLAECEIASYHGCTQIGAAKAIINILRTSHPDATFIIHRDRDFLDEQDLNNYRVKVGKLGVNVFIPEGNDLESYFVKPAHVAATCHVSLETATEIVEAAFQARKGELHEKYVNTRVENILRKEEHERPNSGQISRECMSLMTAPSSSVVHGKTLLKGIRDELGNRKIADHLMSTSESLQCAELQSLRKKAYQGQSGSRLA